MGDDKCDNSNKEIEDNGYYGFCADDEAGDDLVLIVSVSTW